MTANKNARLAKTTANRTIPISSTLSSSFCNKLKKPAIKTKTVNVTQKGTIPFVKSVALALQEIVMNTANR